MTTYRIQRRVQIEEEVTVEVTLPEFLTDHKDIQFYLARMAEGDKSLVWKEKSRGWPHFHTFVEEPGREVMIPEPSGFAEAYQQEAAAASKWWRPW